MEDIKLGAVEARFADVIWQNEPLSSGELVKLCASEFDWKKSTTYTVLKKLCDKGIFQNESGVVSSLISKNKFYGFQGEKLVDEAFNGSLPAFIASFTQRKPLSADEVAQIREMIDSYEEVQ